MQVVDIIEIVSVVVIKIVMTEEDAMIDTPKAGIIHTHQGIQYWS